MEYTQNTATLDCPNDRFWLLDLDEGEHYFHSLQVVMYEEHTQDFVYGNLHLNSRSLVFDPDNETMPLIKFRNNSSVNIDWLSYQQVDSLFETIMMNKSTGKINTIVEPFYTANLDTKGSKASPRK